MFLIGGKQIHFLTLFLNADLDDIISYLCHATATYRQIPSVPIIASISLPIDDVFMKVNASQQQH